MSSGWVRSFKSDPKLSQLFLGQIAPTGKTLGAGSYGSVVEVRYRHTSCAAKMVHSLLLEAGNEGIQNIMDSFRQECQFMADLRHPNIVQFLGLSVLEGSELPALVMERLEMSVNDLLEKVPDVPLSIKISILTDTCNGLEYLHNIPSGPIIHGGLHARDILLTSSLSAKVADFGVSQKVNLRVSEVMRMVPGPFLFMPPEAFEELPRYGTSLDIFSVGHLALHIFLQTFPDKLLPSTYSSNPGGQTLVRSEIERREKYIRLLESQLMESYPVLVEMVTDCLQNDPKARPSAGQLLDRLQSVNEEIKKACGGTMVNVTDIIVGMKEKDTRADRHDLP